MRRSRTIAVAATIAILSGCSAGGGTSSQGDGAAAPKAAENGQKDTGQDQISTFALDVDTASYGYAKSQINNGIEPEKSQIRPEEFVNAFEQDYEEPADDGFSITTDGAKTGKKSALIRVGLQTRSTEAADRKPANLTFVVDVSGSMRGERLDLVKTALGKLVDQLRPSDEIAIVKFSQEAETVQSMTSDKTDLRDAIDSLETEGSTNLEDGVVTGYDEAADGFREGATNRVILLSDGLANQGAESEGPILERIEEQRKRGVTLLGVGVGNEYGDALMERLADKGDGMALYINDDEEAEDVFVNRLPANLELRARDAKAQVVFDKENVKSWKLVGYENRELADEDFRDDSVDGGEIGPGHSVTALYDVRLRSGGPIGEVNVRWLHPANRSPAEEVTQISPADLSGSLSKAPTRMQVSAVAAAFAMDLRGSGELIDGSLAEYAGRLGKTTEDPAVIELASLIEKSNPS